MLYTLFQAILITIVFPYFATAFMTGRTLERRLPLPATVAVWILVFLLSYGACYVLVGRVVPIIDDPRLSLLTPGEVDNTVLISNLTLTALCIMTTLCLYRGSLSSRIMVSLLYSAICFTTFIGIDTLLTATDLKSLNGDNIRNSARHIVATMVIYIPLSMWLPGRMRWVIRSTDGHVGRYIPALVVMFVVFVMNYSILMYGGNDDTRGMVMDAMVVTMSILCIYLILAKLDGEIRLDEYRRDLDAATVIQRSCLPHRSVLEGIESADVNAHMIPAKEVGGDFYDVLPLDGGGCAFIVADVSGKGMPAAMFAMRAKTLVSERLRSGDGAAACLDSVNRSLMEGNAGNMFVTMLLCILDPDGGISYCCAGHPSPLIRREGLVREAETVRGRMLGVLPATYSEGRMELEPGDTLLMFTDGATDAEDPSGEQFGMDRLMRAFSAAGDDPCRGISSSIGSFSQGVERTDDLTLMSISIR